MREVAPNLHVGNETDFELTVKNQSGWAIVQACKEPYHRQALGGYPGRGAPKNHPEYLIARRGDRLILNMVDADNPAYIPKELVDAALQFIGEQLHEGKKVLVHCNQGMSRSAGITLLHLALSGQLPRESFTAAEQAFRKIYPPCAMAAGIRGFLMQNWSAYMNANLSTASS